MGCGSPRSSPTPQPGSSPDSWPVWSCVTVSTPAPEDRIRQAKATGLRNLPCRDWNENAAWLEVVLMATDLISWTKLIAFPDHPTLAKCEIQAFRYRVLHVAARITRGARQVHLRIDKTWAWPAAIATGWGRIRTAFG